MLRRKPHSLGRTPKYIWPKVLGYDTIRLYYAIEELQFKVYSYVYSLYLVSWAPYWLCAIIFSLWPMNEDNCTCCLRKATDYAYQGPNLPEIEKAAHFGCGRCKLIAAALLEVSRRWDDKVEGGRFEDALEGVHFTRGEKAISVRWRKDKDQSIAAQSVFRLYSGQGAPAVLPDLLVLGGIASNSDSDHCFQLIRSWLDTCIRSHDGCRSKLGDSKIFLPSRLIHVHDLRLVLREEISDDNQEYAALTYCWGQETERKQPIPKTLIENYEERRRGVPWTQLTKVFQDAAVVTRRLGLEYLWIDSLCIIQNSKQDWVEQSVEMAKIYGEASIVISATRSRTGDVGIFHTRCEGIEFSAPEVIDGTILLREQLQHENFFVAHKPSFDLEPLFARGWCYQERLLARRIIHFTEHEIVWECNQEIDCECRGIKEEAENKTEGHVTRKEFKAKFTTLMNSNNEEERNQCWMHIIEGYSARSLSYETDRLPALSGIAHQVSRPIKGRYLAGMWESDLPSSLLWYLPMKSRSMRENILRVPGVPSWAWPAVGTGITPHYEHSWFQETIATVRDVECVQATSDTFGKVSGGHIILDAPMMQAKFQQHNSGDCSLVNPNDSDDCCRLFPDSYSDQYLPPHNEIVWCVGIELDLRQEHSSGFKCLVLREGVYEDEYLRISQTNCPSRWARRAEKRIIKIV